jgi:hypothetical protein
MSGGHPRRSSTTPGRCAHRGSSTTSAGARTRPGTRARPQGVSRRGPLPRSLRSRDPDIGRLVPRAQGPRSVQLRTPALRRPEPPRPPGHRGVVLRGQECGPARTSRHRRNPPRGRDRHQGGQGRAPGPVRLRDRLGGPPAGGPFPRESLAGTDQTPPLQLLGVDEVGHIPFEKRPHPVWPGRPELVLPACLQPL